MEEITVTSLDMAAAFDHELFMSWVRAGFTREEALQLLMQQKDHMMRMSRGELE